MTKRMLVLLGAVILAWVLVRHWAPHERQDDRSSGDASESHHDTGLPRNLDADSGTALQPRVAGSSDAQMRILPATPNVVPFQGGDDPPIGHSAESNPTPEARIHFVRSILHDYRNVYGQNPVGSNAEIVAVLQGKNAKRTHFLRPDDRNLNGRGELADHWGTAYFLHQISGHVMEIRSAGPDKTMWTPDDLLVK